MNIAPWTEVRANLREVVDTVTETGTEYVITRRDKPVAVIMGYDQHEALIETLNILSDEETMAAIREGEADLSGGQPR